MYSKMAMSGGNLAPRLFSPRPPIEEKAWEREVGLVEHRQSRDVKMVAAPSRFDCHNLEVNTSTLLLSKIVGHFSIAHISKS